MQNNNIGAAHIVFPDYLRQKEFENRRVFINIVEPNTLTGGFSELIEQAGKELKDLASKAGNALATDANKVQQNISKSDSDNHKGNTLFSIVLPLPNEFTDTQQHDWTTEKGFAGTVIGGMEEASIEEFAGTGGGALARMVTEGSGAVIPGVAVAGRAALGMQVGKALGAMTNSLGVRKPLADPGYFQNYSGSQPRSFNMTFDLVPNNPQEALDIIHIIMRLKEFSSPTVTSGVSLLAPYFFDIQLSNKWISSMAGLSGVVLQNMVVNYGADGAMQQFPDGTPKYIQLGLTFVERKMRTANDFKSKGY